MIHHFCLASSSSTATPAISSTPVLKIFGEAMTEAEVEKIEASDKDRAKNFSLEMLEKMFAEKILQVLQKSSFGRFRQFFLS